MIIGNGLIAKAFKKASFNYDEYIIFASGISNSRINDKDEVEKELILLKKYINQSDKKFIYFSTSSIYDYTLADSMYVKHKKNVEKYIKDHSDSYIIYRLPIVVGESQNPNTLTNYIYNAIIKGETINVFSKACRYLIDVDDVVKYVNMTLHLNRVAVNIHLENKIYIKDLIQIFEDVLGLKSNKIFQKKGTCYTLDNSILKQFIEEKNVLANYNYDLIKKYYGGLHE
jgi:nucleoside-diphosphate-sugar epimerase